MEQNASRVILYVQLGRINSCSHPDGESRHTVSYRSAYVFNAMLHAYRVEEASQALVDADKHGVPVLTIALSVGYQSITPFNNAFREIMGVTPSEYRKQHTS